MARLVAILVSCATWIGAILLVPFLGGDVVADWKPIHLCWWFENHGLPIPRYLVGKASICIGEACSYWDCMDRLTVSKVSM